MKSKKTNHISHILSFFLLVGLLLFQGPVLSIYLSNGAAVGQELNLSSKAELIEHGFIYAADEGMMKTWWIFSFQNRVYKFEEAKFVDELSNNEELKPLFKNTTRRNKYE